MLSYYLLRSLSDNPILLPKGQIEVITGGLDVLNFLLQPKIGIQDGSLNEKPLKIFVNLLRDLQERNYVLIDTRSRRGQIQ